MDSSTNIPMVMKAHRASHIGPVARVVAEMDAAAVDVHDNASCLIRLQSAAILTPTGLLLLDFLGKRRTLRLLDVTRNLLLTTLS